MAPENSSPPDGPDELASIVQLSFLIQSTIGQVAQSHELSTVQARLLTVLSDREPTMQVLAGIMGLGKSSLTGLVDRAEGRGLVERFFAEGSRRSVQVRLTSEGRARGEAYRQSVSPELQRLVQGLPARDQARLGELAGRVIDDYVKAQGIDVSTLVLPTGFA